jgi:hypothetical protein
VSYFVRAGPERLPGTGQILRHKDDPHRWQIKVFLGRENGRKRYYSRVVYGTQSDAETVLDESIREVRNLPPVVVDPSMKVRDYLLDVLLPEREQYVSPKTIEQYRWLAEKHVIPRYGNRSLSSLTLLSMSAFDRLMQADGVPDSVRKLANQLLAQARRHAAEQAIGKNQVWT